MTDTKQKLIKKEKELAIMEKDIIKQLEEMPPGSLRITHRQGKPMYYWKQNQKEEKYLNHSQAETVKQLAQKSYLLKLQKQVEIQKESIQQFLNTYSDTALTDIYDNLSEDRKKLIQPLIVSNYEYAKRWQNEPYESNPLAFNESEIFTERNERVRSKSEKIIADKLRLMGIPYKYECPLKIKGYGTVYPDFTVLNIRTLEIRYWEHLGMMDDSQYCEKALKKLDIYARAGIVQGKQLILTYETSRYSLNMKSLEQIIQTFLL